MKRTLILVVSTLALIAVFAIAAFGWGASIKTTWVNNNWQSNYSSSVTATSTGGAYVLAKTAEFTGTCTGFRFARATLATDPNSDLATAQCA